MGSWPSVLKLPFSSTIKHFSLYFDLSIITTPRSLSCLQCFNFWKAFSQSVDIYMEPLFLYIFHMYYIVLFSTLINSLLGYLKCLSEVHDKIGPIQLQYQFYLNLMVFAGQIHTRALFLHHMIKHTMKNYVLSV